MNIVDYDFFLKQFTIQKAAMDETIFYFADEPEEEERYLGYVEGYEKPYWVGLCDVPNGCEFETAEELLNAPIYQGRSLKERWNEVRFITVNEIPLDMWLKDYIEEE